MSEDIPTFGVKEVAKLLNVSPRTVSTMRRNREIPEPFLLRRLIRWPRKVILDWIEAGCPKQRRSK